MAIIYQGDANILIGSTSISLNCSNVTVEVGYETVSDATVMGDTGRKMVSTLESAMSPRQCSSSTAQVLLKR
jgi:hypothetical protein